MSPRNYLSATAANVVSRPLAIFSVEAFMPIKTYLVLLAASLLPFLLAQCSSPTNPYTDTRNVALSVAVAHPLHDEGYREGDTLRVGVVLTVGNLVDSVTVSLDGTRRGAFVPSSEKGDTVWVTVVLNEVRTTNVVVTAWLVDGDTRERSATVVVHGRPAVVTGIFPAEVTVREGESCTLVVTASGTRPFTYRWERDGVPVTSGDGDTLVLSSLSASDQGGYYCIVTNPWGGDTSGVVTVLVQEEGAPDAPAGLTLVTRTDSYASLSWPRSLQGGAYRLYRAGEPLVAQEYYRQLADTFFVDTEPGEYYYWVTVVVDGIESFPSRVVFGGRGNLPPSWVRALMSATINEGETLQVALADSSSDPNPGTQLSYSLLAPSDRWSLSGDTLRLSAGVRDSGRYEAQVRVSDGELSDTALFRVDVLPRYPAVTLSARFGMVEVAPAGARHRYGDTLTLTPRPDEGYVFERWSGSRDGASVPLAVVVTADMLIEAHFVSLQAAVCTPLAPGSVISAAIHAITSRGEQGTLCLQDGEYNGGGVRVYGGPRILIR